MLKPLKQQPFLNLILAYVPTPHRTKETDGPAGDPVEQVNSRQCRKSAVTVD